MIATCQGGKPRRLMISGEPVIDGPARLSVASPGASSSAARRGARIVCSITKQNQFAANNVLWGQKAKSRMSAHTSIRDMSCPCLIGSFGHEALLDFRSSGTNGSFRRMACGNLARRIAMPTAEPSGAKDRCDWNRLTARPRASWTAGQEVRQGPEIGTTINIRLARATTERIIK